MHTSPSNFLETLAMTMPLMAQFYLLKQTLNLGLCHSDRDKLQEDAMRVKTTRRDN